MGVCPLSHRRRIAHFKRVSAALFYRITFVCIRKRNALMPITIAIMWLRFEHTPRLRARVGECVCVRVDFIDDEEDGC